MIGRNTKAPMSPGPGSPKSSSHGLRIARRARTSLCAGRATRHTDILACLGMTKGCQGDSTPDLSACKRGAGAPGMRWCLGTEPLAVGKRCLYSAQLFRNMEATSQYVSYPCLARLVLQGTWSFWYKPHKSTPLPPSPAYGYSIRWIVRSE